MINGRERKGRGELRKRKTCQGGKSKRLKRREVETGYAEALGS